MSQEFVGPLTVTSALGVQGGSLELGATLGAAPETPYVDFHFGLGAAQDYNVRLLNAVDNRLDVVTASGGPVVSIQTDKMGIGTTTPGAKLVVNELAGGRNCGSTGSMARWASRWGRMPCSPGWGRAPTTPCGCLPTTQN
jgi:hypothetical protein